MFYYYFVIFDDVVTLRHLFRSRLSFHNFCLFFYFEFIMFYNRFVRIQKNERCSQYVKSTFNRSLVGKLGLPIKFKSRVGIGPNHVR